jgi:hypothetical protein
LFPANFSGVESQLLAMRQIYRDDPRRWAWTLGLIVAAISVLLVINVLILGESVSRTAFWLIVSIVSAAYVLSPSGRAAVKQVNS